MDCFVQQEDEDDNSCSELDYSDIDQNYEPDLDRNKDFEDTLSNTSENEMSDNESSHEKTFEEMENNSKNKIALINKDTEAGKSVFS